MSKHLRALMVEDDEADAELVLRTLRQGGFDPEWERVQTAEAMRAALADKAWDIVLCDYMMPSFSAPAALRLLKSSGQSIPFIVVSGTVGEDVAVETVKLGADDYLLKQNLTRLAPALERALKDAANRRQGETVERMNRLILANSLDMICTLDENGRYVSVSTASRNLLGYDPEEMIGRHYSLFVCHDDLSMTGKETHSIMSGRPSQGFENRLIHKDGRLVPAMWSGNWSPDDRLLYLVARDITERKAAEAKLTQERHLLRTLIDHLPDAVYAKDASGRKTLANAADLKNMGCTTEAEALGKTDFDFFAPGLAARFQADDQMVIQSGQRVIDRQEPALADATGEPRWYLSTKVPLRDASGKVLGLVGVSRDITERRRAEATMRRDAEMLSRIQEAIISTDLDGIVTYWNTGATALYGWTAAEMMGRPVFGQCPPAVSEDSRRLFLAAREGHEFAGELHSHDRKGSSIWIEARITRFNDADGQPAGILSISRDITQRKLAEDRLQEQAALLHEARDAILVTDLEGHILYWNKSAERLHGWTEEEVLGKKSRELLFKDAAAFGSAFKDLLAKGEWIGELVALTKSGRELVTDTRWTLVRDERSRPKSVLSISTDITDRKKLESQYLRAQRMESIGALAGGIAHDLNNVFAPIVLCVELLKDRVSDAEGADYLRTVETSTKRGADMVRQVLSFARGVEGKRMLVNPSHLIRDVERILNETLLKSIRMETHVPSETWAVLGDPTQLHQILLNLAVNARDAMPAGGTLSITVENTVLDEGYASMSVEAKAGPHVAFHVTDTGTGIPPEIRDKIFEPFFTTKEVGKGTGLGLATVHAIAKSHGGFVTVYSEVGRGTTFKVYLPAQTSGHTDIIEREVRRLPRGDGELILVVDDEASIRQITKHTLEAFGYRVMVAGDGTEALALYAQHRSEIAAVVTDMMMPVMDGTSTIRALRAMNPQVRVIAASGLGTDAQNHAAATAGAKHFLPKPYTAEAMLGAVHKILHEPP